MGLQPSEDGPLYDGWYNGFNFETYADNDYDEDIARQIGMEYISGRLSEFASDPKMAAAFFQHKIMTTWNEPMFGSVSRGSSEYYGKPPKNLILGSIYQGDRLYHVLELYMTAYCVLMYLGSIVAAFLFFRSGKNSDTESVVWITPFLYFVGGFLFHLISETNSSYSYMYVYCLVPAMGVGMAHIFHYLNSRKKTAE